MPTVIDPIVLNDVSAISFLGTEIIRKYPQLQEWQVGSPADVPLDTLITNEREYSGFGNIGLQSIYPVVEGYKDEVAVGFNASFSDPIMLESIDLSVSNSINSDLPGGEDIHAELSWQHVTTRQTPLPGIWTVALRHNPADFYDLFGPTKVGRKGQSASVGYERTLIYDEPRVMDIEIDLSHYVNFDRLPRYQNVNVTFDELTTFTASPELFKRRKSLGAVDDEKGYEWRIVGSDSYVNGDNIPKFFGNFDFGFALAVAVTRQSG